MSNNNDHTHEREPGVKPRMDRHGVGQRIPALYFVLEFRQDELLKDVALHPWRQKGEPCLKHLQQHVRVTHGPLAGNIKMASLSTAFTRLRGFIVYNFIPEIITRLMHKLGGRLHNLDHK